MMSVSGRQGVKPMTDELQVQRADHYTTRPHGHTRKYRKKIKENSDSTDVTNNVCEAAVWLRKILRVSCTAKKTNEWVLNKAGVNRELLDTVKARKLAYYGHTMRKQGSCLDKEIMLGTMQVHEGEEDQTRPGWTTSRHGQDSPWKSKSEWQRTEINGESTFIVWPTLGSRTATEQNRSVWLSGFYIQDSIITGCKY